MDRVCLFKSFNDVLGALATGTVTASQGSKGTVGELVASGSPAYNALQSFITSNNGTIANKPQAYLNWLFLDEQLNFVPGESGAVPVGNCPANTINTLGRTLPNINKNGYLYIYVNNETQSWDVFFDNLSIYHHAIPVLEETHYYPFGLKMHGISSKAATIASNICHFAGGTDKVIMEYKYTDKQVNETGGIPVNSYNAASYGPNGKGVVYTYYGVFGQPVYTRWDNQRIDGATKIGNHGLYSGPDCVTDRDGKPDFSYQPIDWADAIAKRHDMDYEEATKNGGPYLGYIEDTRTYQADVNMIKRVDNMLDDINNPFVKNYVEGVETPYPKTSSGEMRVALMGQSTVIAALAKYKQWKIENGYTGGA